MSEENAFESRPVEDFDNPLVKFDRHRLLNTPKEIAERANMMDFGLFGAQIQRAILETINSADQAYQFVVQFDCLESGTEFRMMLGDHADHSMIDKLQQVLRAMPPLAVTDRVAFQLQVSVDPSRLG